MWEFTCAPTGRDGGPSAAPAHAHHRRVGRARAALAHLTRARKAAYRGWVYCQVALADPTGERTKDVVRIGQRAALPPWFADFPENPQSNYSRYGPGDAVIKNAMQVLQICCNAMRSARFASSGVLTLKKGSIGWSGQSATAMPCRAVHTSILRKSSVDQRVAQIVAQRQGPQPDHRMAPFARARAGERHAGAHFAARRDAAARPGRRAETGSRPGTLTHPFDAVVLLRQPVETRENAGERSGEIRQRCRESPAGRCRRSA